MNLFTSLIIGGWTSSWAVWLVIGRSVCSVGLSLIISTQRQGSYSALASIRELVIVSFEIFHLLSLVNILLFDFKWNKKKFRSIHCTDISVQRRNVAPSPLFEHFPKESQKEYIFSQYSPSPFWVSLYAPGSKHEIFSLNDKKKWKPTTSINIKCTGCSLYSVFFFIELKVIVNLTYLYLSEIKKQGLIFSVGMGHLIICKKKVRSRQRIFI